MKKFFILVLAIITALSFTGCAQLFDLLNFNQQPLPNTPSVPAPDLEVPSFGTQNALERADFLDIVTNTYDEATIVIKEISQFSWFGEYALPFDNAGMSSTAFFELITDYNAGADDVFVQYSYAPNRTSFSNRILFADDYLIKDYQKFMYVDNGFDYFEHFSMPEKDFAQAGSITMRVLETVALEENYTNFDLTTRNGIEIYTKTFTGLPAKALAESIDFFYGSVNLSLDDLTSVQISFDNAQFVSSINISLRFGNTSIAIATNLSFDSAAINVPENPQLNSLVLLAINRMRNEVTRDYQQTRYAAKINKLQSQTSSSEYDYDMDFEYYTEPISITIDYGDHSYTRMSNVAKLVSDDLTLYRSDDLGGILVPQGNSFTVYNYGENPDIDKYVNLIHNPISDVSMQGEYFDYTVQDGILTVQGFSGVRYMGDEGYEYENEYFNETIYTVKIDIAAQKIVYFQNLYQNGAIYTTHTQYSYLSIFSVTMEFTYDFETTWPSFLSSMAQK